MNAKQFARVLLMLALGGCASTSLNRVDHDNAYRKSLLPDAERGDPTAQYLLGENYCCGSGFYSTTEAIKWWCRAHAQSHPLAKNRLLEHLTTEISTACIAHEASR